MNVEIIIDKLSGHDQEGKVGKINKSIGEQVSVDELIFTVESGKGTVKYTSKHMGILKSLDIDEGDTVKKNQVVGIILAEGATCDAKSGQPKKKGYSFGITTPVKEVLNCDTLIIGGGPGGYVSAIRAAQLGNKTVLVEKDKLGGTCLNYGCIPTKALVQSAVVLNQIKEAEAYGYDIQKYTIDFARVMERKNEVIGKLVGGIHGLMERHGIRVISGEAVVETESTIKAKTNKIEATITYQNMIIAVGASPAMLPIEGADLCEVLTSKEALELNEIPKSITIIGGGIIGMEIAFIFNEMGSKVTVVEFLPRVLACLDNDISEVVKQSAISKGIQIYDGAKATSIRKTINNQMVTEIEMMNEKYLIASEKVLMAVGRKANLDAIDLKTLGVELNERKNGIQVNEYMQTTNEKIYAIGDVTNIIQLAHVASHQGMVAAEHINGINHPMSYEIIPSGIFTMPEVGAVGMSEAEASSKNISVKIVKFPFVACGKAIAMNEPIGFVKLIVDNDKKTILGGAIVGGHGTDLIATISQLIQTQVTIQEALKVIYAHPTLSESIHEALLMADDRGVHFG